MNDFTSSIKECKLEEDITEFMVSRSNNLKSGVPMPFPVLSKTFKGFRKGETVSQESRFRLSLLLVRKQRSYG